MSREPNEADKFIESIASLSEDAERGARASYRTALAEVNTVDDVRRLEEEGGELDLIARDLRTLADRLYRRIVMEEAV
jgi:hypothetical protein